VTVTLPPRGELVTNHSLIVARLEPGAAEHVARLFAASDAAGDLPRSLGARRRHLFQYRDLYIHYVEFDGSAGQALSTARQRADFRQLSKELDDFVKPYDPATWRSPADAMAREFYAWDARREDASA
jgi:polyketide synthesis cyclase